MPRESRVFPYMYSVQFDGTNYILVDADCKSTNGLTPAELGAKVKDVDRDSRADGRDRIGDVAHDQFHVSQAHGHLNGKYSFVSVSMPSDSSGTGFIALDEKTGDYYYFTDTLVPDSQAGTPLTLQGGDVSICFMPGTKIRTPTGEAAVEDLKVGDLVRTADGRAVGIRWIGRQTVAPLFADERRLPVLVMAGAIDDNVPSRDLWVSPDHALFVDGVLIHAGALVNGTSIVRETHVAIIFTYYHLETEDHSLILAENTPAETFIDNVDRRHFDNASEYGAIYPEAKTIAELSIPRAKSYRQVPRSIRERLVDRGAAIYRRRVLRAA